MLRKGLITQHSDTFTDGFYRFRTPYGRLQVTFRSPSGHLQVTFRPVVPSRFEPSAGRPINRGREETRGKKVGASMQLMFHFKPVYCCFKPNSNL